MSQEQDQQQIQTAVRLSKSLLARLDKLAEKMSEPGKRFTRAEVLRIAAHQGVTALEAKHKK